MSFYRGVDFCVRSTRSGLIRLKAYTNQHNEKRNEQRNHKQTVHELSRDECAGLGLPQGRQPSRDRGLGERRALRILLRRLIVLRRLGAVNARPFFMHCGWGACCLFQGSTFMSGLLAHGWLLCLFENKN